MAINLEGYDSTTGKKVPVTESDTVNISLPSSALEVPVFTGNLAGSDTVEEALQTLDVLDIAQGISMTNNTLTIQDNFLGVVSNIPSGSSAGGVASIVPFWSTTNHSVVPSYTSPSFGVLKLDTGASSGTEVYMDAFNALEVTASLAIDLEFRFRLSNTTAVKAGMGLSTDTYGYTTQFLGLFYDSTVGSNFRVYLRDASALRYSDDSGIPADTDWHKFRLVYSKASNSATYYIDGIQVGTAKDTSAWVTTVDGLVLYAGITNTAAASKVLALDWYKISIDSGLGL